MSKNLREVIDWRLFRDGKTVKLEGPKVWEENDGSKGRKSGRLDLEGF